MNISSVDQHANKLSVIEQNMTRRRKEIYE
jgi:hypothetical protein